MPLPPETEFLLAGLDLAMRGVGRQPSPAAEGPFISVVTPVHNRDFLIESALESLERQSWARFEAIVVDDGSTDRTPAILADWANRHAWLRVLTEPERKGHGAARNRGLAAARGDVVAYLDSDNLLYTHALEAIAEAFRSSAGVWWIHTAMLWRTSQETKIRCPHLSLATMAEGRGGTDLGAIAHRRGLSEAAGGFDEKLTRLVDLDLMIRFAEIVMPRRLPVPTCHYRQGDWPRVSDVAPFSANLVEILARYARPAAMAARILYVVLASVDAEALETELAFLTQRNFCLGLYSPDPLSPGAGDRTRECAVAAGSLTEAVEKFRPHLLHVVGGRALDHFLMDLPKSGLPLTLRLETDGEAARLNEYAKRAPGLKAAVGERAAPSPDNSRVGVIAAPAPVDLSGFRLAEPKDKAFVACVADTAAAIALVAVLAGRCPGYRFALDLDEAPGTPADDARLEIHVAAPRRDRAERVARAALFLDARERAGATTSARLVEAMATGAYPLARRHAANATLVEGAGAFFGSEDEAAAFLAWAALWGEERWRSAASFANERAWSRHAPALALRPLYEEWLRLLGAGSLAAREAERLAEVEADETLYFAKGARGEETLRVGFYGAETWGAWTGDRRATLAFVARGVGWGSVRKLTIKARAYSPGESVVFPVRVSLKGGDLGEMSFGAAFTTQTLGLKEGVVTPGEIVRLEFATARPEAPTDHGAKDLRRLGLALAALTFAAD